MMAISVMADRLETLILTLPLAPSAAGSDRTLGGCVRAPLLTAYHPDYVPPANRRTSSRPWARSSAVEHLTFNQRVSGSNPDGLTTSEISHLPHQFTSPILARSVELGSHWVPKPFFCAAISLSLTTPPLPRERRGSNKAGLRNGAIADRATTTLKTCPCKPWFSMAVLPKWTDTLRHAILNKASFYLLGCNHEALPHSATVALDCIILFARKGRETDLRFRGMEWPCLY